MSCSASVDVALRDIHSVPKRTDEHRKNTANREKESACVCERERERTKRVGPLAGEREGDRERDPQNNCSPDELEGPIPWDPIPDTRRPNSTYFCDPNGMSQRLMFLPVFQPPLRWILSVSSSTPCRQALAFSSRSNSFSLFPSFRSFPSTSLVFNMFLVFARSLADECYW